VQKKIQNGALQRLRREAWIAGVSGGKRDLLLPEVQKRFSDSFEKPETVLRGICTGGMKAISRTA
jgi:hypothetical protein